MCTIQHQTGAKHSAVEYTRTKAVVKKTVVVAPHYDMANRLIGAMREVSFPCSDSRCQWYVRDQPSFTLTYVGIWVKDSHFLSSMMVILVNDRHFLSNMMLSL